VANTDVEIIDQIVLLPVKEIHADPGFNCRGHIAPTDVVELARDIANHGLQQPITVMPVDSDKHNFKIICGHRRHKAFEVLEKDKIPCIVKTDMSMSQALILNIGENLHRKDLNVLQEARALERLKLEGFSVPEVSKQLGKATTWVYVRYELLELPVEIQEAAAAGLIKQAQIRDLVKLPGRSEQLQAAKKIKEARIRGEKTPQILRKKKDMFKKKVRDPNEILSMIDHISDHIGMNFGTRCLAWASGEISDLELYRDIRELANNADIIYEIPKEHQIKL